jgi:hypothetical protein
MRGYRQDACLLVRIEYCGNHEIQGYGVVLGDNNSCYDKALLLRSNVMEEECPIDESGHCTYFYEIQKKQEQYRPDLEENMTDQKNAALSGFFAEWSGSPLKKGIYQIGMAVRNRVTGLKLCNWSSRFLIVK